MKRIIIGLLFGLSAFGLTSVQTNMPCLIVADTCPIANLPSNMYFNSAGLHSQQWETRITSLASSGDIALFGPIRLYTDGIQLILTGVLAPPLGDTIGSPSPGYPPCCAGLTDVMLRVQRDIVAMVYRVQFCSTPTGICSNASFPILALGTQNDWTGQQVSIGSGGAYPWYRWYSTLATPGSVIFNTDTSADVLNYTFQGTLTDTIYSLTLATPAGGVSYPTTPTYNPVCLPLTQQSFKAGITGSVTGLGFCQQLDGGTTLTPTWTYLGTGADGVTQTGITFGSAGNLTTTVSGLIKGSVNLNLHLVDGSSNASNTAVHDGAAVVDANDTVITGLGGIYDELLGKMLRYNSPRNSVPFYDRQGFQLAYLQGNALGTNFGRYWDHFVGGATVSVSPTMTCGGSGSGLGLVGTTGAFTGFLVNDWVVVAWNGGVNRALFIVDGVPSSTCIILHSGWYTGTTETGLSFAHPTGADLTSLQNWGLAQVNFPGNYYDSVKAFRAWYERSGIDDFWSFYVTLADAMKTSPMIDQGAAFRFGHIGQYVYSIRSQSVEGLMLRASDPGQTMWNGPIIAGDTYGGLTTMANVWIFATSNLYFPIGWFRPSDAPDTREIGYYSEFMGLYSKYGPDATTGSTIRGLFSTYMASFFGGWQYPDGSILSMVTMNALDGNPVTVTNGSTTLTCAGCAFTSGQWTQTPSGNCLIPTSELNCSALMTYPASTDPINNTIYSSVYYPQFVDAHTLTLDRPYSEASSIGNNTLYGWSQYPYGVAGWNIEPFMSGILGFGINEASSAIAMSDPTNAALAHTISHKLAGWIPVFGYSDPAHGGTGGVYFESMAKNCAYPVQTPICDRSYVADQNRISAGEPIRLLNQDYILNPSAPELAFMTKLLDQMWCVPGYGAGSTCVYDGFSVTDLADGGLYMNNAPTSLRWFGYMWGWCGLINAIQEISVATPTVTVGAGLTGGTQVSGGASVQ